MSRHHNPPTPVPTTSFTDTFSLGKLDTSKWMASDWGAPGGGTFAPSHVDFTTGMLRLTLSQSSATVSIGGEVSSLARFGYGSYEWNARVGTTSNTPFGAGKPVSGSVSGLFNFWDDSLTEIDFETLGDKPGMLFLTNWNKQQALGISQQASDVTLAGIPDAFHRYRYVWQAGRIDFYFDDVLVKTHTLKIPTQPANAFVNFWGINDPGWGGYATVGVPRYMFVRSFSFKA